MFESGSYVADHVGDTDPEQVQPNGVDLTLAAVYEQREPGRIGRDGKDVGERQELETEQVADDAPESYYLTPGGYVVQYAESVEIPENHVGFVYPRSSLIRNSCMLNTAVWDAGYEGRGEGLLQVHHDVELEVGADRPTRARGGRPRRHLRRDVPGRERRTGRVLSGVRPPLSSATVNTPFVPFRPTARAGRGRHERQQGGHELLHARAHASGGADPDNWDRQTALDNLAAHHADGSSSGPYGVYRPGVGAPGDAIVSTMSRPTSCSPRARRTAGSGTPPSRAPRWPAR